jgi:hypothetical protein
MDKNRFNHHVRPHVMVIPIGTQGIAFDRVDLDAWADHYQRCNGRPAAPWETQQCRVSLNEARSGTSTSNIEVSALRKHWNGQLHESAGIARQAETISEMIEDLDLRHVHMGALQEFIAKRKAAGVKTKTVKAALAVVRRILNVAASEWFDEKGMTWLETAPKIRLLPVKDARSPYPLTQEEQALLFKSCPITSHGLR